MASKRIEGFSRNASDLYRIAVGVAGFDSGELMMEIHRRAPNRASISTVEEAMQALTDRFDKTGSQRKVKP